MRYVREFVGFAGIRIESDDIGSALDPSVILLHELFETRKVWTDLSEALALAGRHPINMDLRGHGGSEWPIDGRYDAEAFVGDLKAVLGQMRTRPVLVAKGMAACFAALALADDATVLASGLVLVDLPGVDAAKSLHGRTSPVPAGQPQWDKNLPAKLQLDGIASAALDALDKVGLPTLIVGAGFDPAMRLEKANIEYVTNRSEDSVDQTALGEEFDAMLVEFLERTQPLTPAEFRSGSDARTLRDAMGVFATGVTIITAANADGGPIGLTANSFTSVSLDPPLLLVCVANTSSSAPVLRDSERFAVNVLQIGQQPTSNRFAGKVEDRFADTDWGWGETGVPVLNGSLGVFECSRFACHEAGDHFILVGHVHKASFEPRRDPLLYFRGKYRRLHFT
jgi:flavin reductase (DIM6/NTAB) family NADH-FMN oxidoreductase RutF